MPPLTKPPQTDAKRKYDAEKQKLSRARKKDREEKEKYASPNFAFDEFFTHVRQEALKPGTTAQVKGIYKDLLNMYEAMRQGMTITADEIARMHLDAERELREGGYLGDSN